MQCNNLERENQILLELVKEMKEMITLLQEKVIRLEEELKQANIATTLDHDMKFSCWMYGFGLMRQNKKKSRHKATTAHICSDTEIKNSYWKHTLYNTKTEKRTKQ